MVGLARTPHPPSYRGVDSLLRRRAEDAAELVVTTETLLGSPAGSGQTAGERITARFFAVCEHPRLHRRVVRTMLNNADGVVSGRLHLAVLSRLVFGSARVRAGKEATIKTEMVLAQLIGMAVVRYVTKVEPVASMPVEELVRRLAPSVQAILDG